MRPAFPASDYYEGSATRPALAEGWSTPLPESRTCFPSSTRLHLHAVLGPACTPGTARCRARHRRMPIKGSTASLPEQGCLCKEETEIPMTPPSPYRERVVRGATLQSAVPFVTITALWLAARGVVGWPPPHCREGFRHDSASGPRACFPSHRPTPGRVPHLERSTYALLGAPPFAMWTAFPSSDYYGGSVAIGLASRRQSRIPCAWNVIAQLRCLVCSLIRPHWSLPNHRNYTEGLHNSV